MEIRKQGTLTADHDALKLTKLRSRSMIETENLLYLWIKDCNNRRLQISLKGKQFKVKLCMILSKANWLISLTRRQKKLLKLLKAGGRNLQIQRIWAVLICWLKTSQISKHYFSGW